ncbi:EB domain-containing protein [Caenorhabditis elegans]|uniref:EB domain-containing protein n=1 Tax=Caenorhabditis elegans TaxID=6239 RepID=Q7YTN0_CAEEL|nr:EB domain-containing protein [Caenorhabditis elegans]CAE17816.1 EB domain-containing protein [Caenorhabditis elegans]|eukprot:NP_001021456.1 Uncharacterized protein CELE_F36F2.8 [Caenorhabditis elegans]
MNFLALIIILILPISILSTQHRTCRRSFQCLTNEVCHHGYCQSFDDNRCITSQFCPRNFKCINGNCEKHNGSSHFLFGSAMYCFTSMQCPFRMYCSRGHCV